MKNNYHAHTFYCKHALQSPKDMVDTAYNLGYEEFGISEHICYHPKSKNYGNRLRLELRYVHNYIREMVLLKHIYNKKDGNFKLLTGFESEYLHSDYEWYKTMISLKNVDYLIFGNHNYEPLSLKTYFGICTKTREDLELYAENTIKGMKTGLFLYIAHPDLFVKAYEKWDKHCEEISHKICAEAQRLDFIFGFNINGLYIDEHIFKNKKSVNYPSINFWKIAQKYNIKTLLEVDGHNINTLNSNSIKKAYDLAKKLKLRIIEKPDFNEYYKTLYINTNIKKKY